MRPQTETDSGMEGRRVASTGTPALSSQDSGVCAATVPGIAGGQWHQARARGPGVEVGGMP